MGLPYGPWRDHRPRPRHPYTLLPASEWMKVIEKLRLVSDEGGKVCPYDLPTEGMMEMKYQYHPRVATPVQCLNATGMKASDYV